MTLLLKCTENIFETKGKKGKAPWELKTHNYKVHCQFGRTSVLLTKRLPSTIQSRVRRGKLETPETILIETTILSGEGKKRFLLDGTGLVVMEGRRDRLTFVHLVL